MQRPSYLEQIEAQFKIHSVCALLGPRQVGKTTLANAYAQKHAYEKTLLFDMEDPLHRARLENPMLVLGSCQNSLIIIDEIQLRPELFPLLRVLVDNKRLNNKYLILGSASRDLIRQSSESLAGRIGYIEVMPFSLSELAYSGVKNVEKLWVRGGFPPSYLAESEESSYLWRQSYITTYLERDIPLLGFSIPPQQIRRFWLMLTHYHGQVFKGSELGQSLGLSHHTTRKYLDILVGTFMVRSLAPWHENLSKRQVKSPKIYFRDSGILNALLGFKDKESLETQPRLGAFWEGFALEEILRDYQATSDNCYFWATQAGAELDLLILKDSYKIGFEFKYTDVPKVTPSMKTALLDLKLDHLYVIYPGQEEFALTSHITARGLCQP